MATRKKVSLVCLFAIIIQLLFVFDVSSETTPNRKLVSNSYNDQESQEVQLHRTHNHHRRRHHRRNKVNSSKEVVMDNGIVEVTLSIPEGFVTKIKYQGIDNLLENNRIDGRGYWDIYWYGSDHPGTEDKLRTTKFKVIKEDKDQVEISFTKQWKFPQNGNEVPLNIDKRYILRRGDSGFYMYVILEREKGFPDVNMDHIRAVFKLRKDKFHYMAISDDKQRIMPMPEDRVNGQRLDYDEAVKLVHPTNPLLDGEVDDKYQYSIENKDNKLHGWICSNPMVGFWMITPSNEFYSFGPLKQSLTSHVGPTVLNIFTSTHYAGKEMNTEYKNGEPWKKVLGPVFVYLNTGENPLNLWADAKQRMLKEVESWPYDFPQSKDYPKSHQRGIVSGRLQINDRYLSENLIRGDSAYVGLAAPGEAGSWQKESQSYQFWTQADKEGNFSIKNVREGTYSLYAWVPGVIGDYKYNLDITIAQGSEIKLGVIVYEPPRNGPTLWEIGIPDRTAAEFFVPEPYPYLTNYLYINHPEKFRQYGLWERYTDLYPSEDLKYTIGTSDYTKDWLYAQGTRKTRDGEFIETTWQVIFEFDNVIGTGNYTLQLALAASSIAEIQVRFNNGRVHPPLFSTGRIGNDNAIARHGIHGLYKLYSINVPSYKLKKGSNIINLTQPRHGSPFHGVMYDYIRFEGPPRT